MATCKVGRPQAAPSLGNTGNLIPTTASGGHPNVVMVGMGDGSIRGVSANILLKTWNAVLTPDKGETVGDF